MLLKISLFVSNLQCYKGNRRKWKEENQYNGNSKYMHRFIKHASIIKEDKIRRREERREKNRNVNR